MIRGVAIFLLSLLLVLVLYLPSAHPPERFVHQLRLEHLHAREVWGAAIADRVLDRALSMASHAQAISPVPGKAEPVSSSLGNGMVREEMARVNQRLFDNAYFRSIDALLVLAIYRLCALLEWMSKGTFLLLALLADSVMKRVVKTKEFARHDPEVFALCLSTAIIASCACVLALTLPVSMHPLTWVAAPLGIFAILVRAVADFHRRG
jgi:hypothetical protein